jgi:hypothetical protein
MRRLEYVAMMPEKTPGEIYRSLKIRARGGREKCRIQGEPETKVTGRVFGSASDHQTFGGPRHPCLVIDRMHEETGENGDDRAAGRADRRL